MAAFGHRLAAALPNGAFAIALAGPLGAGKSTFARALLRGLGIKGPIPSPTYTLVEPYAAARGSAYHVDLYRLQTETDMRELGLEESVEEDALILVEWPERGAEGIISFDLALSFEHDGRARRLSARALTAAGAETLNRLRVAS